LQPRFLNKEVFYILAPIQGVYLYFKVIVMDRGINANNKEQKLLTQVLENKVPVHVAVVMDGNGRWAKNRGLPRAVGHKAGMDVLREIVKCAHSIGLKVITFYAFSTENWKRPRWEVDFLMRLPEEYLQKELPFLQEKDVRLKVIGNLERLPKRTQKTVEKAIEETKDNQGLILNFALNYGGRLEIINAVKKIASEIREGALEVEEINEDVFADHLYTKGLPDPDLLIRPSGELRLSNFLLWQMAYTEFWFNTVLWPDFKREDFLQAILDYQNRERRFGGIGDGEMTGP
jgi:undecaprenyl diphosphate synthase